MKVIVVIHSNIKGPLIECRAFNRLEDAQLIYDMIANVDGWYRFKDYALNYGTQQRVELITVKVE